MPCFRCILILQTFVDYILRSIRLGHKAHRNLSQCRVYQTSKNKRIKFVKKFHVIRLFVLSKFLIINVFISSSPKCRMEKLNYN